MLQTHGYMRHLIVFLHLLNRDIATQKAIKEARFLLEGRNMSEAYSFDYYFTPIYNKKVTAIRLYGMLILNMVVLLISVHILL